MGTTDNGYSAPPSEGLRDCGWDGAFAVPGVKDWDPVWDCFQYLMREFDQRVEWLRPGWCWGYAFRPNANNPNALSRHSGAIAIDLNAPLHPNGVPTAIVFTSEQIRTINRILDEIKCSCHGYRVFRWGGDYTGTPDGMHFEINVAPGCVKSAAQNLNKEFTMDNETIEQMKVLLREAMQPVKEASVNQTKRILAGQRRSAERDANHGRLLRAIASELGVENPNREELIAQARSLEESSKKDLEWLNASEKSPHE